MLEALHEIQSYFTESANGAHRHAIKALKRGDNITYDVLESESKAFEHAAAFIGIYIKQHKLEGAE